jgi:hypothetical protein
MKAFPRDVTVQTMTVRHVGIENELGVNAEYDSDDVDCWCCCEDCCDCNEGDVEEIEKGLSKRGLLRSIGFDGGGREFRTHPISVRSLNQIRGFKYVTEYYGLLSKNTTVLNSGGTHIHISILNTDHENTESNATAMATAFYEQFQKISGRKTSWASQRREHTIEEIRNFLESRKSESRTYSTKGSMLNPTYHQTLEFRGPKGSNDSKEVLAWVEFLDNVVKTCNRESVEGIQFKRLLRGKRISAYVEGLTGWRKLTKIDLEQRFNGAKLQ